MKRLPIGKQDFSSLINEGYIYVDKTEYLYKLITTGAYYFLSRPRRFGKSLLVSTLKEIFLGNKELFKGLWIQDKVEWKKHPVIHIDFSELSYKNQSLDTAINKQLNKIIKLYSVDKSLLKEDDTKDKFVELVKHLSELGKVVILIDEYDKPIIDYIDNIERAEENREILKNFFSAIKPLDSYIQFVFITGVSKFSHVSVFSDLNHLLDISYHIDYSKMLGYTQSELEKYFPDYINQLICAQKISEEEIFAKIKEWYNGYSWDGSNFVYNPFSVLNLFSNKEFADYWFRSGTPSFLIKLLKSNNYPVTTLANQTINRNLIDRYEIDKIDITVLLLQTGYLTIKRKDNAENTITLDFPNFEVENSFVNYLFADYIEKNYTQNFALINSLSQLLDKCNIDEFVSSLKSLFAGVTYQQFRNDEAYFHSIFYLTLKLLGFAIYCEILTNRGRIDAVIKTSKNIYIIEFKMTSAEIALQQIKDNKYHEKYLNDKKQIVLLGIGFNEKEKNIHDWKFEMIDSKK